MKNTRWIAAAASAIALSASLAIAGTYGDDGLNHECRGGHHKGGAHIAKKLNLSDAQKEQWKALENSFRQNNSAFLEQARQTREEYRAAKKSGDTAKAESMKATMQSQKAQMKQLRDAMEPQQMSILNDEQRAKFQAMKAEREARGGRHRSEKK